MANKPIQVKRLATRFHADPTRVIARPFIAGDETRIRAIVGRILSIPEPAVESMAAKLIADYAPRHRRLPETFENHYAMVASYVNGRSPISEARRALIGSYFTSEYSLESVALFNPSIVPHPDQSGLRDGRARFILSLRACGEGHISSIEFRSGVIDADNGVTLDPVPRFAATRRPIENKLYNKARFYRKLVEIGAYNPQADGVLCGLREEFTIDDLQRAIEAYEPEEAYRDTYEELARQMLWIAHSNYQLEFPPDSAISERVIFPVTENESRGIEDARFVRFTDDDGSITYYGVYTAYNGYRTLPQFLETSDFLRFKIYTLTGRCVQNKGMALFPRRIDGWYWMVSRLDGENIHMLRSDNLHFWNESFKLRGPVQPWEFVQIGNCGSPIETDAGWLLLTHGVGPMRQYWLGALLLDLGAPTRVIGHLEEPILVPEESERDGYVPNVVYSCGAMVHHDDLVIPYAVADTSTAIATVSLKELLAQLTGR